MTIYRNHYGSESNPDESQGFIYHISRKDAKAAEKNRTPFGGNCLSFGEPFFVPCTKHGVVAFLQKYASHPDNG